MKQYAWYKERFLSNFIALNST